jgi:Arc/MetJ-type ribon-helix-helix transcriptional regulator
MSDELIHIRVGKEIKKEMQKLIDSGLFTNQSEIAREGIRTLILKYQKRSEEKNEE